MYFALLCLSNSLKTTRTKVEISFLDVFLNPVEVLQSTGIPVCWNAKDEIAKYNNKEKKQKDNSGTEKSPKDIIIDDYTPLELPECFLSSQFIRET